MQRPGTQPGPPALPPHLKARRESHNPLLPEPASAIGTDAGNQDAQLADRTPAQQRLAAGVQHDGSENVVKADQWNANRPAPAFQRHMGPSQGGEQSIPGSSDPIQHQPEFGARLPKQCTDGTDSVDVAFMQQLTYQFKGIVFDLETTGACIFPFAAQALHLPPMRTIAICQSAV
jgi:hypothetical protein